MFKKMYLYLFNVITDALEEDNIEEIKKILIKGQQIAEDMYIDGDEN